jgi:hypothetical protein
MIEKGHPVKGWPFSVKRKVMLIIFTVSYKKKFGSLIFLLQFCASSL